VIAISDGVGTPIVRLAYGVYGGEADQGEVRGTSTPPNDTDQMELQPNATTIHPFGYTGRRWDPDLGLYYYRARWYDPQLGTFLETDPIGSLDYINLYSYVGAEPGNGVDPSGMECIGNGKVYKCRPRGPNTATYFIPQMAGLPNILGKGGKGVSHMYRVEASRTGNPSKLAAAAGAALIMNPTPGNDMPATPSGTRNPALPVNGMVRSYVTTDTAGRTIVANVTIPGEHALSPGIVTQRVETTATGAKIVAIGEGNGWGSIPTYPLAVAVFQAKIDGDMARADTNVTGWIR
jgi:RHS repeat-associated protein